MVHTIFIFNRCARVWWRSRRPPLVSIIINDDERLASLLQLPAEKTRMTLRYVRGMNKSFPYTLAIRVRIRPPTTTGRIHGCLLHLFIQIFRQHKYTYALNCWLMLTHSSVGSLVGSCDYFELGSGSTGIAPSNQSVSQLVSVSVRLT